VKRPSWPLAFLESLALSGTRGRAKGRSNGRSGRLRLLALLILFDALLVTAVVLSFQRAELMEEEVTLIQTREVHDISIRQQVITHTEVITQIIPYGSQP